MAVKIWDKYKITRSCSYSSGQGNYGTVLTWRNQYFHHDFHLPEKIKREMPHLKKINKSKILCFTTQACIETPVRIHSHKNVCAH